MIEATIISSLIHLTLIQLIVIQRRPLHILSCKLSPASFPYLGLIRRIAFFHAVEPSDYIGKVASAFFLADNRLAAFAA